MLSASEREEFREQIKVFRTIVAPIVYRGDLYRLWNPFEVNEMFCCLSCQVIGQLLFLHRLAGLPGCTSLEISNKP